MQKHIGSFRDAWLAAFFVYSMPHRNIPAEIHNTLARKLDIINAATSYLDLRSPPGNRFEALSGKLQGYSSIRVNHHYRLIFRWVEGKAEELYLDPHDY